jgi:metallo-beta-lactamase class B
MRVHPERAARLAERVARLVALRRTPKSARRIAVVLFNFPPNAGNTGSAAYLNVFPSLQRVLAALAERGWRAAGVLVTHGHFDHFGGTPYLQRTYKPRVLMSAADWDFIAASPQRNRELPARDVSVTDGQTLTLGDTTLTMMLTPGHTPGSIAILIPVKERGKQYVAFMPSGGFAAPDRQALAALERALDVAKKQRAAALLSGHPGIYGDTLAQMETRRKNPDSPNPFLYDEGRFARYLSIAYECTKARLIATEQIK